MNVKQRKTERMKYSTQFKEPALERAKNDEDFKDRAKDIGIAERMIYYNHSATYIQLTSNLLS